MNLDPSLSKSAILHRLQSLWKTQSRTFCHSLPPSQTTTSLFMSMDFPTLCARAIKFVYLSVCPAFNLEMYYDSTVRVFLVAEITP